MRNPNGFGGISKLSGKRRNPYRARVTIGWDESGKQQYKTIGYYHTRKEALEALSEYSRSGAIDSDATFKDVYKMWSDQKYGGVTASMSRTYQSAYTVFAPIENKKISQIKTAMLQAAIDNSGKALPSLKNAKIVATGIFNYAVQNDLVDRNYAEYIDLKKYSKDYEKQLPHVPFLDDEINKLLENVDSVKWVDTILIMIYTGVRVGELLSIKAEDVHLDERYMIGGSKTKAGRNRVIPIHHRIIPFVQKYLDDGCNLLITYKGKVIHSDMYRNYYWKSVMDALSMQHRPHDCRHTFASLADTAGMNPVCRKKIMGHATLDITEGVYTHKHIEELLQEIEKLK